MANWELVCKSEGEQTHRMRVQGGMIYRVVMWSLVTENRDSVAMVFVPISEYLNPKEGWLDKNHRGEI